MIEAIIFMCLFLPYMAIAYITKTIENDFKEIGWITVSKIIHIIRYPFSFFDEFYS